MNAPPRTTPGLVTFRIVMVYLITGCLWIYLSDITSRWWTNDADLLVRIAIIKGSLFMLTTAGLLYVLLRRYLTRLELRQAELEAAAHANAQAARAVRDSEDQLRAFINANTEPSFLLAADGTILVANAALARVLGQPIAQVVGHNGYELLPLNLAAERKQRIDEVFRTNQPVVFEDSQSGRYYLNHIHPVARDDGQVTAVAVFALDITERKQAEAALRTSEERFRALIETTSDWVWEVDQDGRYVYVSPRVTDLLGYTPAELLGRRPMDLMPPAEAARVTQAFATAVLNRAPLVGVSNVNLHKDGREIVLETSGVPIIDKTGHFRGYRGIDRDVTDRRRVEQQLRLQASALEAAANGILISDRAGTIEWVNDAFTKLTGYTAAEVIGRNPSFLRSDQHDSAFYDVIWRTILAGRVWQGELINRRKDGSLYPEEMTITPVRDAHEQITHFIAIKHDITQRRHLEEQLRQSQKMDAVGRLAGGVAHDFNNILTAILGYASMLQLDRSLSPSAQQHVLEIGQAAERAAALTRQLLAFGRKQAREPKVLDLNTVITDMSRMLRRLIGEHIDLTLNLAPGLGNVVADRGQIEQVLLNLAVNARDAMPGGGQLTIRTTNVALAEPDAARLPGAKAGRYILITVRDNGAGMNDEVQLHLFEPFFTTKASGQGTGLGLATCHSIVTQSGGFIHVDTKAGAGTAFKIYLPRVAAAADAQPAPSPVPAIARGTGTILVVEDEPALRELSREVLRELGYTVIEAGNGVEALQLVEQQPDRRIDLLFSDVVMPQMGGRQLAEWFRANRPGTKIVFTSGYTTDPDVWRAIREGEVEFIEKPFTPAALAAKLHATLQP